MSEEERGQSVLSFANGDLESGQLPCALFSRLGF
jgi:hypothetical protein